MNELHDVTARPVDVPSGAEAVERGRHLATTRGCNDCHGKDYGGNKVIDDPAVGRLYGPNLTPGRGGLTREFTDLDYVRAIRHGVTREGRPLVLMPAAEYTFLSDEDLGALIAYLKTLPAVDRERGPVAPGPIFRTMMAIGQVTLSADVIDHGGMRPAKVVVEPTVAYGKYLSAGCTGCHGDNLSGGKIPGAPPDWPATSNLTPHASGRLASWSERDFFNVLRTRKRPDGTELSPVMPASFGQMTDVETQALWAYLRSLPPYPTGERAH